MEICLENTGLEESEKRVLESILARQDISITDDLHQMWYLMDLIWKDLGCDNGAPCSERVSEFYNHPIWVLNTLFVEQHPLSKKLRKLIGDYVVGSKCRRIVDYGGGGGSLAGLIATGSPDSSITIIEPHPSHYAMERIQGIKNIKFSDKFEGIYDCLICTDVLEHVPDPLVTFSRLISVVKNGGTLIVANCFYPVIQCHLPSTFHFRYTFKFFARLMGLKHIDTIGGSYALVYVKRKEIKLNWFLLRFLEKISKSLFPIISLLLPVLMPLKKWLVR